MQKYVAYYRVSTQKQGQSGLGLESQRRTVENYCQGGVIIAEFTDIESGRKSKRPELTRALALTKQENAILIIAKLDRLSRNVHFTSFLMESKVRFKCCDMPEADEFTITLFAALAQKEARMISERTKAALESKKLRMAKGDYRNSKADAFGNVSVMKPDSQGNYRLGSPKGINTATWQLGQETIRRNAQLDENNLRARRFIQLLRQRHFTYQQIADELNQSGFKTRYGKEFKAMTVKRLCQADLSPKNLSEPDS